MWTIHLLFDCPAGKLETISQWSQLHPPITFVHVATNWMIKWESSGLPDRLSLNLNHPMRIRNELKSEERCMMTCMAPDSWVLIWHIICFHFRPCYCYCCHYIVSFFLSLDVHQYMNMTWGLLFRYGWLVYFIFICCFFLSLSNLIIC